MVESEDTKNRFEIIWPLSDVYIFLQYDTKQKTRRITEVDKINIIRG